MFRNILYEIVAYIALAHEKILALNDASEYSFSDKQLHFLVIGAIGMLLLFIIHPLFSSLAKKGHILAISWLYVFTLIIVLAFAIEIGQQITRTGSMEFADIVFGVGGFLLMFAIFASIRAICKTIADIFRRS